MPTVQLVHELPWRVRFRVPALLGRAGVAERVARRLAELDGVDCVRVHPTTGSVLLVAEDAILDSRWLAAQLSELLDGERGEDGRPLADPVVEAQPGPTRIASAVAHAIAEVNGGVRARLDYRADIGTVLPVMFAIGGFVEAAATGELPAPPWFNLLWWSIRSFMTFNPGAVAAEARAGAEGVAETSTELDLD